MTPAPPDPTLPARLRTFHERLPLAGDPRNAVLALPDDRLRYLVAVLRDTPIPAPAMTPEAWQGFLDLLRPHGVSPLLAYRLRAWPEECRPPAEVMAFLNRVFLYAAARTMRAGRDATWLWQDGTADVLLQIAGDDAPGRLAALEAGTLRWTFLNSESGGEIQIVSSDQERGRFTRYCNQERIRCGLIRVDETGIVVEHPVIEVD